MAPISAIIQRNFAAGEIAPGLYARADQVKYASGLKTCQNFFVRKEGGVSNRAGWRFLGEAGDSSGLVILARWLFTAANDSILIEAGNEYFRFWQNGSRITVALSEVDAWDDSVFYEVGDLVEVGSGDVYYAIADGIGIDPTNDSLSANQWYVLPLDADGNVIYEIPTPYTAGSFDSPGPLHFAQSGAILTITHPAYAPRELANLTGTGYPRWVLSRISTDPAIDAPDHFTWTPGIPGPSGGYTDAYVVTAIDRLTGEESYPSPAVIESGVGRPSETAPNVLGWDAHLDADDFRIYRDPFGNGVYGYIGTAQGQVTFNDVGFAPDFLVTPPVARDDLFGSTLNYPELSTFYQQRRVFGYTDNEPATVWASRIGYRNNFTISKPMQDDDSIKFTLESNDLNVLRHLINLKRLVLLTEAGPIIVRGDETGALIPTAINADQEGTSGSSRALPTLAGNNLLYVQARGSIVRDLRFTSDITLVDTRDQTVFAGHLFERKIIKRLEYQEHPHSIVWAVRTDGTLLGLTYVPEQEINGWHRHDTVAGAIEDICVVPEADEDVLYAVIRRTIDGNTVRYIERLERREIDPDNFEMECFFVDSGVTYNGAATLTIDGLDHLEGEVVAVLADGLVQFDGNPEAQGADRFTVVDGAIELLTPASVVHVGLPIRFAQVEPLPFDAQGTNTRDKRMRAQEAAAVVDKSSFGFYAGPDADHLFKQPRESWQASSGLVSERLEVSLTAAWRDSPTLLIRQTDPLPLTILALLPSVEVGE